MTDPGGTGHDTGAYATSTSSSATSGMGWTSMMQAVREDCSRGALVDMPCPLCEADGGAWLRCKVKPLNSLKLSVAGLRLDRAMSRAVTWVWRSCEDSSLMGVRYCD